MDAPTPARPPHRWIQAEAEALDGIRALVADIVSDLRANGEPLPSPVPWEWHDAARLDSATAWSS